MTLAAPLESIVPAVDKKYRVIQWGMGNVGTLALRHFAHNPSTKSSECSAIVRKRSARTRASSSGSADRRARQHAKPGYIGYAWTAMEPVNSIPAICDAPRGSSPTPN